MFRRLTIALCGLLLGTACSAQTSPGAAPYTDGVEYVTIASPAHYVNDGKVDVVEVFSYGCIHCDRFVPYVEKLRKELPAGTSFHLLPADFSAAWEPYARAFYAARQLGVVDQTHAALFKAKFQQNYPLNSLDDLADFYARQGVDRAAFMHAATSAQTDKHLVDDTKLIQRWGVDGTPTIVVDGKYRSNQVKSLEQLAALTRWLVQRELKAKGQ